MILKFGIILLMISAQIDGRYTNRRRTNVLSEQEVTSTTTTAAAETTTIENEIPTELNSPIESSTLKLCSTYSLWPSKQLGGIDIEGNITIVTKLSSKRVTCVRAVPQLNRLENRFRMAGYKNIQFVVLNYEEPTETLTNSDSDDMASNKTEKPFVNAKLDNVKIILSSNVHDGEPESFRNFYLGSAYIFDTCGRLAYTIYHPWSCVQRPYVKAGILSTIYDEPCGKCGNGLESIYPDISSLQKLQKTSTQTSVAATETTTVVAAETTLPSDTLNAIPTNLSALVDSEEELNSDAYKAYEIPIKIIFHTEHVHKSSDKTSRSDCMPANSTEYLKFDYILLNTNDTNYHQHLPNDCGEVLSIVQNDTDVDNNIFNETTTPAAPPNGDLAKQFIASTGERYESVKNQKFFNENGEVVVEFDEVTLTRPPVDDVLLNLVNSNDLAVNNYRNEDYGRGRDNSSLEHENDLHYSKILQWIHFKL